MLRCSWPPEPVALYVEVFFTRVEQNATVVYNKDNTWNNFATEDDLTFQQRSERFYGECLRQCLTRVGM